MVEYGMTVPDDPPDSLKNNTDYTFPPWWGDLLRLAEMDDDPMTREQAEEIRSNWFWRQRELKQLKRQYDAGMWDQWDEERLDGELTIEEAINELQSNDYQIK
jgi:hypothetical protein